MKHSGRISFVGEGKIASNLHVIEGAARGYAKLIGQETNYDIEGISAVDPERNLVVLKISAARPQILAIGNSDILQAGEPIYAVGNPQGMECAFSRGIVSSIRKVGSDKLLQITAPISPAISGGPVLNSTGEVIGISVATYKGGQNLNFAIPSKYLTVLLTKVGAIKPLANTRTTKINRSILADLGGRSTEGVVGGQLTWTYKHSQSGQYSFSIRNQLQDKVKNVYFIVVFYDSSDNPIDIDFVQYYGEIPAGLAKRIDSRVDSSVQALTTSFGAMRPKTKVEFRILDFQMV